MRLIFCQCQKFLTLRLWILCQLEWGYFFSFLKKYANSECLYSVMKSLSDILREFQWLSRILWFQLTFLRVGKISGSKSWCKEIWRSLFGAILVLYITPFFMLGPYVFRGVRTFLSGNRFWQGRCRICFCN